MSPRLDDNLLEYSFTQEELRMAMILDPLKVAYLHTLRAQYLKQRASTPIPGKELEFDFVKTMIELDGKISMLVELLDNHTEALKAYNEAKQSEDEIQKGSSSPDTAIAKRASDLVHRIQT